MRYRRMGRSGLKVSEISLGGWFVSQKTIDDHKLTLLLGEALERGVNLLDLADIYDRGGVETRCGDLLRGYPRHQVVLSTKCYWPMSQGVNDCGLSRKHIYESVHASLRRLQTDYIDIFHCHRFDQDTPLDETIRAIGDLIRQGKILYWGVCGWNEIQLQETQRLCQQLNVPTPISHQLLYNLIERGVEREALSASATFGLGVMAWSPLAGGVLARAQNQRPVDLSPEKESWLTPWTYAFDHSLDTTQSYIETDNIVSTFIQMADKANLAPAQLGLLWALRRPEVSSLVIGVSSLEQLKENLKIFEHQVSEDTWGDLEELFPL